jgi:hypothetical protein
MVMGLKFNVFLNILRISEATFPTVTQKKVFKTNEWITEGIKISYTRKLDLCCDSFLAAEINKVFSGYQPCQFIKNHQCFRDHLCPHH